MGRVGSTAGAARGETLSVPELEATFRRRGFVVAPILAAERAAALRRSVLGLLPQGADGLFDLLRATATERDALSRLILAELAGPVGALLIDHDLFLGTVFAKFPGSAGDKQLHTDWTMVDEASHVSGQAWVALEPITEANGALSAVPGSQLLDIPYRGSPDVHFAVRGSVVEAELARRSEVIEVPIGHAVIFDHRLLHSGRANLTSTPRIAVGAAFKPRAAALHHYHREVDGSATRFTIEPEFLTTVDPAAVSRSRHVLATTVVPDRQWDLTLEDLDVLDAACPAAGPG